MDVGATNGWRLDDVVPAAEIVRTIGAEFPLEPVDADYRGEVAQRYRYLDGGGEIGVIASVTQPFCGDCTRARLSADGKLYTCLFAVRGHDLRAVSALRRDGRRARRHDSRRLGAPHRPLLGAPQRRRRARCARSRCPTSAADAPRFDGTSEADASRRFEMRAQVAALESNTRVFRRRRNPTAPATWLGASRLPVRHLDGLLRRVPGRARQRPTATSSRRSRTVSGSRDRGASSARSSSPRSSGWSTPPRSSSSSPRTRTGSPSSRSSGSRCSGSTSAITSASPASATG